MRGRIATVAAAFAALAAIVAVTSAFAAYGSPKLEVTQTVRGVVLKASLSADDDPTARVAIEVPVGATVTTSQAPGTVLGPVRAVVRSLDNFGLDVPLEGTLVVAAPGQVAPDLQARCIGSTAPLATWLMTMSALGQTLTVPTYLLPQTQPQLGPAFLVICLPPPDVPSGTPGRSPLGAKVHSAELTVNGVFGKVASGAWISSWVPYNPGEGTPNVAGAVVAPAAIAPGAVTIRARATGRGAVVTGSVTQGGAPRPGATVTVRGGSARSKLRTTKRVRVAASGAFTARFASGTFFRADAAAPAGASPAVCAQLRPVVGQTPCVNPTVNGFAVQSAVVRKK